MGILDPPVKNGIDGRDGQPGPPGPIGNTIVDNLNGSAYTLSPAYATEYTLTITADSSLVMGAGSVPGSSLLVDIFQDGDGGHVLTLPSSWIGADDIEPNLTANEYDRYVINQTPAGVFIKKVGTGSLPSSLWTPSAIADQLVWYNADSLIGDDGDPLTSVWNNSWANSGKPNLTFAGSPLLHIQNGTKYVQFQSANSQYAEATTANWGTSNSQPLTYGVIARITGTGEQHVMNGSTGVNNQTPELYVSGSPQHWFGNTGDTGLVADGDFQYITMQCAGDGSPVVRVNGSAGVGSVGSLVTQNGWRIARSGSGTVYYNVDVAEELMFGHIPDSTELANLEGYLANKVNLLNS